MAFTLSNQPASPDAASARITSRAGEKASNTSTKILIGNRTGCKACAGDTTVSIGVVTVRRAGRRQNSLGKIQVIRHNSESEIFAPLGYFHFGRATFMAGSDDLDDFDGYDEPAGPKPRVTILTVVLIVLNAVAALGFVYLLAMDFHKRQEWSYQVLMADLSFQG